MHARIQQSQDYIPARITCMGIFRQSLLPSVQLLFSLLHSIIIIIITKEMNRFQDSFRHSIRDRRSKIGVTWFLIKRYNLSPIVTTNRFRGKDEVFR